MLAAQNAPPRPLRGAGEVLERWVAAVPPPARVLRLHGQSGGADVRVALPEETRRGTVRAHAGHVAPAQLRLPLLRAPRREDGGQRDGEFPVVPPAVFRARKARIGGDVLEAGSAGERLPLAFRRTGEEEPRTSLLARPAASVEAVQGREAEQLGIGQRARRLPGVGDEVIGIGVGVGAEHRHADVLPDPARPERVEPEQRRRCHDGARVEVRAELVRLHQPPVGQAQLLEIPAAPGGDLRPARGAPPRSAPGPG